jgi:TolB-like protein/Tfp pilus assembly protein PilF
VAEGSGSEPGTGVAQPALQATPDRGSAGAAFISYASQDAGIAKDLCAALERDGVRCWIAPRDVRPGDFYADSIVQAINACAVLVLVLSQSSISSDHVLREVERASAKKRPILAFRIDAAPLPPGLEYFLSASQWIDSSGADPDRLFPKLIEAIRSRKTSAPAADIDPRRVHESRPRHKLFAPAVAASVVIALGLAYLVADKYWLSKRATAAPAAPMSPAPPASGAEVAAFAPPAHSIAVLPFANMSGDAKQDYFSDGLSEELLNSLAAIPDLQVVARTSSFAFRGQDVDVAIIAHKLNVGAVLEGSVRKDGSHVRITAELINALTGFQLWSQTYDRDLKSVLALQAEIATAVTRALQATLLASAATAIEVGGTQNPGAFDAYLRGKSLDRGSLDKETALARIATYSEAIRLDPKFAKAYVGVANAQNMYANNFAADTEVRSYHDRARESSEKAIELAPQLGEAHAAVAYALERGYLDFARAMSEYERALSLAPNDADVLLQAGVYFTTMGRADAGLSCVHKAIALDQLNPVGYARLSLALTYAHKYREAIEASERALQLNPKDDAIRNYSGFNHLLLGEFDAAQRSCATPKPTWVGQLCLAVLYDKLHRRADAEAQMASMKAELGDGAAYQYAEIYAQWGDIPKALDWLETAYRMPDPGIGTLLVDALVDPLRKEPRFQEIERKLQLPN